MAKVRAFRGIRYNTERFADNMNRLVAPPYDVIDDEMLSSLYESHINNIVRMDLNRAATVDNVENNRYTRARRYLMDWLAEGDLTIEDRPTLYVHEQTFTDEQGQQRKRRGFIGLVELAEYDEKIVLPHERTLRGPKEDRLALMKATECNLSQIFMLYEDPEDVVAQALASAVASTPDVEITTPDGITHRTWKMQDEQVQTKVAAFFASKQVLIADGHHRYETALAYRDFRRECAEGGNTEGLFNYVMTFFVNTYDEGLVVFPTHRVLHDVDGFDPKALLSKLDELPDFKVTPQSIEPNDGPALAQVLAEAGQAHPSFVLLGPALKQPMLVSFVGDTNTSVIFDDATPPDVRALDVTILHEGILEKILGISREAQAEGTFIAYHKRLNEVINASQKPSTQLAVMMNPTPVEQVASVCRSGGKMPQKSTYFYPKILSGLVINPL